MSAPHPIVGTWRLVAFWTRYDGEDRFFPLGEDALGAITYTADGFMSGTMQRRGVRPFAIGDRMRATAAEKADAFDAYVTYCGRWTTEGGRFVHSIEMSLLPNWIGDRQYRDAVWHGPDRVDLVARQEAGGRGRLAVVEWERSR